MLTVKSILPFAAKKKTRKALWDQIVKSLESCSRVISLLTVNRIY